MIIKHFPLFPSVLFFGLYSFLKLESEYKAEQQAVIPCDIYFEKRERYSTLFTYPAFLFSLSFWGKDK